MADWLREKCDHVDADVFLTALEKARQKASIKAHGIAAHLADTWSLPHTFSVSRGGRSSSVMITSVSVRAVISRDDGLPRDLLHFDGVATRDGVPLRHAGGQSPFPIDVYSPPIADNGPDLRAVVESVLGDVVGVL